jgi:hypothetical protein
MSDPRKPLAIFLLLGGSILTVAILFAVASDVRVADFVASALANLAFVLLAVAAVEWIWGLLGGAPLGASVAEIQRSVRLLDDQLSRSVRMVDEARRSGLDGVKANSGDYGADEDWMRVLRSARRRVDLMGYSLYSWTQNDGFVDAVVELVAGGAQVRILTLHETHPQVAAPYGSQGASLSPLNPELLRGRLSSAHATFDRVRVRLEDRAPVRGSYEVRRLRSGYLHCHLCRTDDQILAISYLAATAPASSPLFRVAGKSTPLFKKYEHEFERLWGLAEQAARPTAPPGEALPRFSARQPRDR